jgi:cell division protein FtsI/penicillin-binding protein 2
MIRPSDLRRLFALAILTGLALMALGARLVQLQVVHHEEYRALAENNRQRTFLTEPRRGDILDANGHPLATSLPVKKVVANPLFIGPHAAQVARVLAPLLQWDETELAEKLRPVTRTNAHGLLLTNQYVNLRRKVSVPQWQQISSVVSNLAANLSARANTAAERRFFYNFRRNGIYAVDDQQRLYPSKSLAAHVIGFVQEEEREFNNTSTVAITGRDGIESWLNPQLSGVRGWRTTETDRRQRELVVFRQQNVEPRPGLNAVLTLDLVIQEIVENELAEAMKKHAPVSASAVVVRPRTGEILALATLPNFDPNQPGEAPEPARRNRVIADVVEPGSTFKIVVVSAALNEGLVDLDDTFHCEWGEFVYRKRVLRDHERYGVLSVQNIITRSSNIGAAKIGLQLGEQPLYEYIRAFGFGTRTGITLGAEEVGIVHPVKKWDGLAITRITMGHAISVTHLQMAMAMSALANQGRLMRPMLIKRLQKQNGELFAEYEPQLVRQVITERAARDMLSALKTVVATNGTGSKAMLDHYNVAGKTGTAQKAGRGGYVEGKYVASFIGFFPADRPELCISVVLDEPLKGYYGGQTAAPVFKRIAEQAANYLKIRPDRDDRPTDALVGPVRPERPERSTPTLARKP